MAQPKHEPLGPLDGNRQAPFTSPPGKLNPLDDSNDKPTPGFENEAQQHQSLHHKLMRQQMTGQQTGTYVSPSDNIMSPASAKLNAYKQNRFAKASKPRSLFARPSALSSEGPSNLDTEAQKDVRMEQDQKMNEG